ncbi:MCE family protein [Mycobacterium sp. TNTM28]|uniref:MCE family protein n=1 Tax=[Mycobacterium] fortunisiensis TaxID=2600579 RepID=A0ABS6KG91_9MYCO|nr:MlaD family protein [[Mycobacterium] fortunisiensis]MBU9762567.1 MCE family protein [[Mycobacterium] fortunisiensis]
MRIRNLVSFAALAAIIVVAIGYIAGLGVRLSPPDHRTNLSMAVESTNGLVVGSNVLLRGVPVGKVTAIRPTVDAAAVDFYIDGAHQVPVDSVVRLDNLSALGEAYIGLFPRTSAGPMLTDGQRIATESVQQPPSIADLAVSVGRLLEQADPEQLKRIVAEADTALPDPDAVLPNISRAGALLRNETTSMNGRGQQLLDNIQTLLAEAGYVGPALAGLAPRLHELGPNMQAIFAGAMGIVLAGSPESLQRFKDYLDRIQNFLDTRSPDVKVLAETLLPNIRSIGSALTNFDTGQLLGNMLRGVPADGAINLRVTIPPPG